MGSMSPCSTPQYTPLQPEIVDASTPWSDVILEEYALTHNDSSQKYRQLIRGTLKSSLRHWNRPLWLAVLLIAGIWWSFSREIYLPSLAENVEMLNSQVNVEGLQFIDATHPYIRVGIFMMKHASTANAEGVVCWSLALDLGWRA